MAAGEETLGERVLQLQASDFVLLVLALVVVFYTLPRLAYRYLKTAATAGADAKPQGKAE